MVGLIHGEHADRECAYPSRHPPAQPRDSAVLAHGESLAVLQDAAGKLAGSGDPGLADDREAHLHEGPSSAQPCKPRGRIAQIVLARKVDAQHDQLLGC
jgi:hypothetical protein